MILLSGIYPPIATPFTDDGERVDEQALAHNVDRWMATRLRGLVVLGSNGEAAYVDDEEAERIIGIVRERVPGDRLLIAGTGRDSTRAAVRATVAAARAGADLVLVRTPNAFRPEMTASALVRHYTAVADASPVPVLLYTFPQAFGVPLPIEAIAALADHPNVAGMKDSSGDLGAIADEVSRTPDRFQVLVGSAATLLASLSVGATGGILAVANVVPDLLVELLERHVRGDHAGALALQRAVTPFARAVTVRYGVPGLKAAMTLAGYRGGSPRAPLAPAPEAVVADLERLLAALPSPVPVASAR